MKIRTVSFAALAAMALAVALTILNDDHFGVLDGQVPRAVHTLALSVGAFCTGWSLGALHRKRRTERHPLSES